MDHSTQILINLPKNTTRLQLETLLDQEWSKGRNLTLRAIAHIRSPRFPGLGYRELGRCGLEWLAKVSPDDLLCNLQYYIGDFGRWDDIICLMKYEKVRDGVLSFTSKRLLIDLEILNIEGSVNSMAAKWIPSEGKKNNQFNQSLAKYMGLTHKELRKILVTLRNAIGIPESRLSTGTSNLLDYSNVPKIALNRYTKAFERHDPERFSKWKDQHNKKDKDKDNDKDSANLNQIEVLDHYLSIVSRNKTPQQLSSVYNGVLVNPDEWEEIVF